MVAHEKTHEYGFIFNKESYTLGNDTRSEMGKHCHVTKELYCNTSGDALLNKGFHSHVNEHSAVIICKNVSCVVPPHP